MNKEKIKEYRIVCAEVLEIINNISYDDYIKIPKDIIQNLEDFRDKNNAFTYNPSLTLDEQNVSEEAKAIIAVLYRDYLASQEQRKIIENREKEYQGWRREREKEYYIKEEEKKKKNYNPENLFSNIKRNNFKKESE